MFIPIRLVSSISTVNTGLESTGVLVREVPLGVPFGSPDSIDPMATTSLFPSPSDTTNSLNGGILPSIPETPVAIPTAISSPSTVQPSPTLPPSTSSDVTIGQNLASASLQAPAVITATVFAFPPNTPTNHALSAGAGAGIAVVVCIILAALLGAAFIFWTRRKARHTRLISNLNFKYRSGRDVDALFGARSPSPMGASQTSLPPEALRTSPYTVRKPPPRYTLVGAKPATQEYLSTSPCEKPTIAYPDIVYIQGTRVSQSSLTNPHSPTSPPELDVISISKQDDLVNDIATVQAPELVLKHPGYLSPISGSVRVGRLLRSLTQRTGTEGSRSTRAFGPEDAQTVANSTVCCGEEVTRIGTPPQYPSPVPIPSELSARLDHHDTN